MTPFSILTTLAGLSQREASEMLGVRLDTVKSWGSGRNTANQGAIRELQDLIVAQERAARENIRLIKEKMNTAKTDAVEIGYPADDYEARILGWPCVGAWQAMMARVIAALDSPVFLVPRGSTPSTAAAADAHQK